MKNRQKLDIRNMVLVSMFTGILVVLSQISFLLPGGMPVTLQTFAVVLLAFILGSKLGAISVIVYILIGCVGFPVFANFKSGASVLFGPTGGYLVGFIFLAIFVGLGSLKNKFFKQEVVQDTNLPDIEKSKAMKGKGKKLFLQIGFSVLGLISCHICGLIGYGFVTHSFLPTAPILFVKDVASAVVAILIGRELQKRSSYFL